MEILLKSSKKLLVKEKAVLRLHVGCVFLFWKNLKHTKLAAMLSGTPRIVASF